jgi:hypothetical protein
MNFRTIVVPLASALGRHPNPRFALKFDESRQWVGYGTNHLDLLSRQEVYAQIRQWLAAPAWASGSGIPTQPPGEGNVQCRLSRAR